MTDEQLALILPPVAEAVDKILSDNGAPDAHVLIAVAHDGRLHHITNLDPESSLVVVQALLLKVQGLAELEITYSKAKDMQ